MKLLYIEQGVYGYILVARRVLYMAGSLRYRWLKHPLFNAHSLQCRNTPYAHCTHFSHVKYVVLQYNVVLKKQLETLVYIEHGVYGYIMVARRVHYMAVSLRNRWLKHP